MPKVFRLTVASTGSPTGIIFARSARERRSIWAEWMHVTRLWATMWTDHRSIVDHVCRLAVLRELQIEKQADVVTMRERYRLPTSKINGALSHYRTAGAIEGKDAGRDPENWFTYKRWFLTDDKSARDVAGKMHCRLMPPDGKARIVQGHD